MRKFIYLLILPLILVACVNGISGKVIAVADGDTFALLTADHVQHKIRLYGIDCPEKKQAYGQKAKEFTSALIFGKDVTVDILDIDRYDRIVGIVYVDSTVLNEELLSAGYAWHYKQYDNSIRYASLESDARQHKRGLWEDSKAVAPWDFRKTKNTR